MNKIFLFVIGSALFFSFQQNERDENLVQVSGVIIDADSTRLVPFATITNLKTRQTHTTNYQAYFSIVASKGDSILVHAIGYAKYVYVVPKELKLNRETIVLKLNRVVMELPEVRVFPWASLEEFKEEFMALYDISDVEKLAQKNTSHEELEASIKGLPEDGQEIQKRTGKTSALRLTLPTRKKGRAYQIQNPLVWAQLIDKITYGDKIRREEDTNESGK